MLGGRLPFVLAPAILLAAALAVASGESQPDVAELIRRIEACDGSTPDTVVAAHLRALQEQRSGARAAGPALAALLPERSRLYEGRGPNEAERLRAYLLVTLAEVGPPPEALPYVLADIAHGHRTSLLAAAARAAGALGPSARAAVPYLAVLLGPSFHDDQTSLTAYAPSWPLADPTTVRLEAVRALGRIGPGARAALPTLRALAAAEPAAALTREARRAVQAIEAEGDEEPQDDGRPAPSAWLPPELRAGSPLATVRFTDQDGRSRGLAELSGRPLALTFAFTRCGNPNKCPLTMSRIARLQRALQAAELDRAVRLAVVTLDPELDTPEQLARFAGNYGFRLDEETFMLRPQPAGLAAFEDALQLAVSRGAGQINGHGVELYLFDRRARYVRHYYGVAWDDAKVTADLEKLAAELP